MVLNRVCIKPEMFLPESNVRIWPYSQPTDMRKSFDGLCGLIRTAALEDAQLIATVQKG